MKVLKELSKMIPEVKGIADEHGWNDARLSDEHYLMMIITEVCEAIQADRTNNRAMMRAFDVLTKKKSEEEFVFPDDLDKEREDFIFAYENCIEGTVEGEMADIVIRIISFFGLRGMEFTYPYEWTVEKEKEIADFLAKKTFTEIAFGLTYFVPVYDWNHAGSSTADNLTRCADLAFVWAKSLRIDLMKQIRLKIKYNALREYKHGKKY